MQLVVRQISGLGNQLFQYAAGRYYSERLGATMRVALDPAKRMHSHGSPRPFLLSHFSITAPVAELSKIELFALAERRSLKPFASLFNKTRGVEIFREGNCQRYRFLPELSVKGDAETVYLVGYWQTHRMVNAIGDSLRAELAFRRPAEGKNLETLEQIEQSRNPVSLHVRRGDYTLAAEGNIALSVDYYTRAIATMQERLDDPTFFVFSDDIAFTKASLPAGLRAVFVEHNDSESSQEDLRLMAGCHHHIIANSTFSWWGAWLNGRPGKIVIAPKYWHLRADTYYPDLMPPDWILSGI
jgi:hypothetical protein